MSKGSRPRPYSVTQQEYDTRWDAIFARDLDNEENNTPPDNTEETIDLEIPTDK